MSKKLDRKVMRMALREALRGRPSPNPYVGAAIVRDGRIVLGYHSKAGLAHAEVDAIRKAGELAKGATLYVTFEPCNHVGRTGPCTEAIIAAGIRRVVIGCRDPHPHVPGAIERLRSAGIEVEVGVCDRDAQFLIEDFSKHISTGRPFVIAKMAITLDGRMATARGDSKWITGERARREAHRWRHWSDAVMVGVGTVLADDPELTVRHVEGVNPMRIVMDTHLRTPLSAKVLRATDAPTILVHGPGIDAAKADAMRARGVELLEVPLANGHADIDETLRLLGKRDIVRLLVEGGPTLHQALFARGLVDRVAAFVAPRIVGDPNAPTFANAPRAQRMDEAIALRDPRIRRLGHDVLIVGDVPREEKG